jgi:hypothetical protein
VLVSEFENVKTRFFMGARLLAKCDARMRNIAPKYSQIPYIVLCAELRRQIVLVRMPNQNHDLSLIVDAFTCHSKVTRIDEVEFTDTGALFLDFVFEDRINQEIIALLTVQDDGNDLDAVEEGDVNDEDDVDAAPESESLQFDPDEQHECIETVGKQLREIQAGDEARSICQIGCTMIAEPANRSRWQETKERECQGE